MNHYKRGKNVEEELSRDQIPLKCIPDNFLWMHVKNGTKVSNVLDFAKKALDSGEHRAVVWSGSGGGVSKTISCAEILKRSHPVHQVTRLCYRKVEEYWDPQTKDLETIIVTRQIPSIHILTSLDELNKNVLGYQDFQAKASFWSASEKKPTNPNYKHPKPGGSDEKRRKIQYRQGSSPYQKSNRKPENEQTKDKTFEVTRELQQNKKQIQDNKLKVVPESKQDQKQTQDDKQIPGKRSKGGIPKQIKKS